MSQVISVTKQTAVVCGVEDNWVIFDVGGSFTRKQTLDDFEIPPKVGDKFLHTDILESLDDQPEEKA
jgi:hypothetical protein